jgi:hypothetical protein
VTIKKEVVYKLNDSDMWVWRRTAKASWQQNKTNDEVLVVVGEDRRVVQAIMKRKRNRIGHVVRGNNLFKACDRGKDGG